MLHGACSACVTVICIMVFFEGFLEFLVCILCRYLVADLAQVMISYLPEDSLHQLYELVLPLIGSLQPRPQKKAYQMLFHLTSSNEPVCVGFVECHAAEIAQSLVDSSSCVCAGSRRVSRLILPLSSLRGL